MTQRVLVTGGTGYLGSWCIVRLLEKGYRVRTTVRSLTKADAVRDAVASQVDPHGMLEVVAADLMSDDGWATAMAGVDGVLHVASPLGGGREARDPDAVIRPAVEGTVRVLRAAIDAAVPRVVVTSSGAAATPVPKGEVVVDDALWTDPDEPGLTAYRKSKVLAERAAWDTIAQHSGAGPGPDGAPAGHGTQLVTVLPAAIFGPALPGVSRSSTEIIERMLQGKVPLAPRIEMGIVDVRDLADLHVLALERPEAAGQRFLASGEVLSMLQIAQILRSGLGAAGAKAPRRSMPDGVVRLLARVNPELQVLVPMLGRRMTADAKRARDVLGWHTRPAGETVLDTGRMLLGSAG